MTKLALRTVAGLVLALAAACGGSSRSSTTPAAPAASCGPMASHVADQLRTSVPDAERVNAVIEQTAQVVDRVLRGRCEADGWSSEAIACFTSATGPDTSACEGQLTEAQKTAVQRELETEIAKMAPPADEPVEEAAPAPDDPCGGGE